MFLPYKASIQTGDLEKKTQLKILNTVIFMIWNKAWQHQSTIFLFSEKEYQDREELTEFSEMQAFISEKNTKSHCFLNMHLHFCIFIDFHV